MKPYVIGFAGGSGSGKSTIIQTLLSQRFGQQMSLLKHDAYYLNRADMPGTLAIEENWDHPDALDNELFISHLKELIAGNDIQSPVYDFANHRRSEALESVQARKLVLLDGILILAIPEVLEFVDLKVFVDTRSDECLARRILRDVRERGRDLEGVIEQYRRTVRPMHERFVSPSRARANLIIPWDSQESNDSAVEVLLNHIESVLGGKTARV